LEPGVYTALQRWADSEMRSMNAQIEFLLRDALKKAGRLPKLSAGESSEGNDHGPRESNSE
jgi:hypothetical protein